MNRRALITGSVVCAGVAGAALLLGHARRAESAAQPELKANVAADVRTGALSPVDARIAYDITPLPAQKADGSGLTIAVIGFEHYEKADILGFRKHYGIDGPDPKRVVVSGGPDTDGPRENAEVSLDMEVISAIAPKAQIISYEAPNTEDGALAVMKAALAGPADVVSYSWGACDLGLVSDDDLAKVTDPKTVKRLKKYNDNYRKREAVLKRAVQEGVTFYVSSGDRGAYDCQDNDFAVHDLTVDRPSDSVNAISVGGTLLSVRKDGTYLSEAGWESPLSNSGGGGGINTSVPVPKWQLDHGIARLFRGVPDVSASASPSSMWHVLTSEKSFCGKLKQCWVEMWGTSASAPFWAAAMLVARQYADRGVATRHCFMAPVLYTLAYANPQYKPFHDVTLGGNRHYPAKPGWDYATGLGSPDVWNIARDLGPLLKANPGLCTHRV